MLILVAHELTLFAVVWFIVGGVDDLIIDAIWIGRWLWRRLTIYPFHPRVNASTLAQPKVAGPIIIFVAAWDEAAVIDRMLDHAVKTFDHHNYRIYVGCYPNDPATIGAVRGLQSPHIRVVVGDNGIM
jgi:bacteriophage N4 adsorption protein B